MSQSPLHHRFAFTLGRSFSFQNASHQGLLILITTCFLSYFFYLTFVLSLRWEVAVIAGMLLNFTMFLSWAFGRELDPDHNSTATIAVLISLILSVRIGFPEFLLCVFLLLVVRAINQTASRRHTALDLLVIILFAGGSILSFEHNIVSETVVSKLLIVLGLIGALIQSYNISRSLKANCDQDGKSLSESRFLLASLGLICFSGVFVWIFASLPALRILLPIYSSLFALSLSAFLNKSYTIGRFLLKRVR